MTTATHGTRARRTVLGGAAVLLALSGFLPAQTAAADTVPPVPGPGMPSQSGLSSNPGQFPGSGLPPESGLPSNSEAFGQNAAGNSEGAQETADGPTG